MEIWDIYDETNHRTGETIAREDVDQLKDGQYHACVNSIIVDENGLFLVQQRAFTKETNPGAWDLFTGGSLLAGETPQIGIEREVAEELGIKELAFSYLGYDRRPDIKCMMHYFVTQLPSHQRDSISIQTSELEQVAFWTKVAAHELAQQNPNDAKWFIQALKALNL